MRKLLYVVLAILAGAAFLWSIHEAEKDEAFSCEAASVILEEGDDIYGVAQRYCDGNVINAVSWIMVSNGLATEDLGYLRPGRLIVVDETPAGP